MDLACTTAKVGMYNAASCLFPSLFLHRGISEVSDGIMREKQTSPLLEGVNEEGVPQEIDDTMVMEGSVNWNVACNTMEEWTNLVEQFKPSNHPDTKSLVNALQGIAIFEYTCNAAYISWL